MKNKYSIFALIKNAFTYHENWQKAWRDPEPKKEYDAVIVGGGGWFSDNYKVIAFIPINTNHSVAAKESRKFNEAQWEEKQGVNNAGWGYGTPNEDIWGPLTGN